MKILQPETYLIGLIGLLFVIAVLVGRQLFRVRQDESNLNRLEKSGASSSKNASELYELASVQLRKRLYPQAITTLKKALKLIAEEPEEAKALIENALGFALAAQDDFESAVEHYRTALKAKPDYPVALNNLAFAKQKLKKADEAKKLYQEVLTYEPTNKTALKQIKRMENNKNEALPNGEEGRGF